MSEWVEPDGRATTPGQHHHYAIWDHEEAKWDPCLVDPEQQPRADLAARIIAAVERLPEHGEWSERCGWVGAITKAAVLDAIREEANR